MVSVRTVRPLIHMRKAQRQMPVHGDENLLLQLQNDLEELTMTSEEYKKLSLKEFDRETMEIFLLRTIALARGKCMLSIG